MRWYWLQMECIKLFNGPIKNFILLGTKNKHIVKNQREKKKGIGIIISLRKGERG